MEIEKGIQELYKSALKNNVPISNDGMLKAISPNNIGIRIFRRGWISGVILRPTNGQGS
jgi:hypothetical protein